jgi:hypothetical protein
MQTPNYGTEQFIDAASLNTAGATTTNNLTILGTTMFREGLVHPEVATIAFAGLVATVTLPPPFSVIFSGPAGGIYGGVLAQAHGTTTNVDTQTYTVSFSGLVPASGTIQAFCLASYVSIQQDPIQIIGPPPGHPDYDPAFVPYVSYLAQVDSLALTASTTPPDAMTTFEVFSCTLTAGASGVTNITTAFQERSSSRCVYYTNVGLNGVQSIPELSVENDYFVQSTASSIYTLLQSKRYAQCVVGISSATSGTTSILTTAPDLMYGIIGTSGVASFSLVNGDSIFFLANPNGGWTAIGLSPSLATRLVNGGASSSISATTGWQKIPDPTTPTGFMIKQWGPYSTSGSGPDTIELPIAFPNVILTGLTVLTNTHAGGGATAPQAPALQTDMVTLSQIAVNSAPGAALTGTYTVYGYRTLAVPSESFPHVQCGYIFSCGGFDE